MFLHHICKGKRHDFGFIDLLSWFYEKKSLKTLDYLKNIVTFEIHLIAVCEIHLMQFVRIPKFWIETEGLLSCSSL